MQTEKLLEQVLNQENLEMAASQVRRNRGAAGVDGMTTGGLVAYLEEHGEEIKEQIRARTYKPKPALVIAPIFEEHFHDNSYGFRPCRNAQQAILKALEEMNDHKLMSLVANKLKDGDVVSLIRKLLVSGIMIDDEYEESIMGTP